MLTEKRSSTLIRESKYLSRDLSWIKFNDRVLDQVRNGSRSTLERLKFLAITASNLDEFMMIRVGSLYNYLDYNKERTDYSGLRELPFKRKLFEDIQKFSHQQNREFREKLAPKFSESGFIISGVSSLKKKEKEEVEDYFMKIVFPMLTPMLYDSYHTFPILINKVLIFGVITKGADEKKENRKTSFVQIPQNLPRFYEIDRGDSKVFVPLEEIIKVHIAKLYKNVEIISVSLLRLTRNGDFTIEESEDIEASFVEEIRRKLKDRKTGRVVRIEVEEDHSHWLVNLLKERWELDDDNVFVTEKGGLIDYTALWQIINLNEFKDKLPPNPVPVPPMGYADGRDENIFELLKEQDVLLHHPYNSFDPVLELIEKAAEDPTVLSIKLTIYRLANDSRVTDALLKAAENGKNVSVLFELKARFDEENNIREAKRLQKAGCFVIYGMGSFKTHTKLLLIVRKQGDEVTRYVHMSSGNYNEDTASLYTDLGLLSSNENYAQDISEFFNVITGHSMQNHFRNLITAPNEMRDKLIGMIREEAINAQKGLSSGIVVKINSLEDNIVIDELYNASNHGVPIKLIVRGICCLRPGRKGLSENISVKSIVGNFLEHSRIFYFHNNNQPKVYSGSADIMVRSFDKRIESLFLILDQRLKNQAISILDYNLKDNINSYILQEDGNYVKQEIGDAPPFNVHQEFFNASAEDLKQSTLF
ncbi:polyphosphate kinase 1 [Xanthovirga aplysinae]|uniref:polyphosphate kinase 1 n=1 Tax=Xanthovirga aplysinae TaxID=2529853 RepID=UPI0012BCB739|nr:polyphosphate kinase 1 [Xanthovirga aplysinae]MTI32755.1 polyphosphate kinase 1 [Xanthovirga aplysinae]